MTSYGTTAVYETFGVQAVPETIFPASKRQMGYGTRSMGSGFATKRGKGRYEKIFATRPSASSSQLRKLRPRIFWPWGNFVLLALENKNS